MVVFPVPRKPLSKVMGTFGVVSESVAIKRVVDVVDVVDVVLVV